MQFIDLQSQYVFLKKKIDSRIQAVLDHGKYISGPEVAELEDKLADYVGVKHAITCANGTDALTLALMAMSIGKGDAVFVPTFTFFASAESISLSGATPIFIDSDKETFNICPVDLERQINKVIANGNLNLKAIMAVDLFGLPANYPEISKVAEKYGLKIIEDAAQGFGGAINEKKAGSFGDISTTSFFPAKPLGCYGDGGAIFTDNDHYAELIRSYSVHGKGSDKYDNIRIGMNSRLDTIQAAILLEKLDVFPLEIENRNKLADFYHSVIPDCLVKPNIQNSYTSSWAQYTVVSDERLKWMERFKESGIPTVIYYPKCMHQQTAFKNFERVGDFFPVAEELSAKVFSLPMHPYMNIEELEVSMSGILMGKALLK